MAKRWKPRAGSKLWRVVGVRRDTTKSGKEKIDLECVVVKDFDDPDMTLDPVDDVGLRARLTWWMTDKGIQYGIQRFIERMGTDVEVDPQDDASVRAYVTQFTFQSDCVLREWNGKTYANIDNFDVKLWQGETPADWDRIAEEAAEDYAQFAATYLGQPKTQPATGATPPTQVDPDSDIPF